jgi:hypothetical protein
VVPPDLADLATELTSGATSPCARALALQAALRTKYAFSSTAPTGTNVQIIRNFLLGGTAGTGPGAAAQASKTQGGTSEQFAASFALLGRALGLPTRIVVGFADATPGPDGAYDVSTGAGLAWPEVDFTGIGWMAFQPTPPPGSGRSPQSALQKELTPTTPSPGGPGHPPSPVQAPAPPRVVPRHTSPLVVALVLLGITTGVVLALLGGLAGLVAAVRARRRRRRRQATSAQVRILGAWLESVDCLADLGIDPDPSRTNTEVVDAAGDRLGPPGRAGIELLGQLVNNALFGVDDPAEEEADQAWRWADDVAAATRLSLSSAHRVVRAVDFRILARR